MNIEHVNWNVKTANREHTLRLVFLGYSFTPDCIKHLQIGNADLSVVYNYRNIDFDTSFLQGRYIEVIAWSMGVWAANMVLKNVNCNIQRAVAINGTPYGIHEQYGIPKAVFFRTIRRFDFDTFKTWCFKDKLEQANFVFDKNPREELEAIYNVCTTSETTECNIQFDKAIVSTEDIVFPNSASDCFTCKKQIVNGPHYPFFNFDSLNQILEL